MVRVGLLEEWAQGGRERLLEGAGLGKAEGSEKGRSQDSRGG